MGEPGEGGESAPLRQRGGPPSVAEPCGPQRPRKGIEAASPQTDGGEGMEGREGREEQGGKGREEQRGEGKEEQGGKGRSDRDPATAVGQTPS